MLRIHARYIFVTVIATVLYVVWINFGAGISLSEVFVRIKQNKFTLNVTVTFLVLICERVSLLIYISCHCLLLSLFYDIMRNWVCELLSVSTWNSGFYFVNRLYRIFWTIDYFSELCLNCTLINTCIMLLCVVSNNYVRMWSSTRSSF